MVNVKKEVIDMLHSYIKTVNVNSTLELYGAKRVVIGVTGGLATFSGGGNRFRFGNSNSFVNGISELEFPVIDGKSPSSLRCTYTSSDSVSVNVFISELGGVPSDDYWDL